MIEISPFYVDQNEVQKVQYGSDETKTHRKIYHLLGKNGEGRSGRLLVSELFTVGKGGWSGFPPHKHDTDRLPIETKFDGYINLDLIQKWFWSTIFKSNEKSFGPVHHIKDGSTILIDKGYHPCVRSRFSNVLFYNHRWKNTTVSSSIFSSRLRIST